MKSVAKDQLSIGQHCREQVIDKNNVYPGLSRHVVSLGHSALMDVTSYV